MPPRRRLAGSIAAIATLAVAAGAMLPWRSHLDIAVVALVLVVPVVVGVVIGGFTAGAVAVVLGFLLYDLLFIPPYGTLSVGRPENWAALGVYVVVMLLVSRVVDQLWRAETASRQSERDTAQLFELSELLVGDRPEAELFGIIVRSVREAFGLDAVALFLPEHFLGASAGQLNMAAHDGRDLTSSEILQIVPSAGTRSSLRANTDASGQATRTETVVLSVSDRTVGLLGIVGPPLPHVRRELLSAFANHIALAVDRSQLREQALRVRLLEEVDRHRRTLFGAVSHDLRTPLATIKASASALLDPSLPLTEEDRAELASLVENQSDRLERVVSNLLDLSRIQAGALVLDTETLAVAELFASAIEALGPAGRIVRSDPGRSGLSLTADRTLLIEALVNVLENAMRYSPAGSRVELAATEREGAGVRLSVTDEGPGFPAEAAARVFEVPFRSESAGGTGLGLYIARSFVEANGGSISVDQDRRSGTRILIDLPAGTGAE